MASPQIRLRLGLGLRLEFEIGFGLMFEAASRLALGDMSLRQAFEES